MGHKTFTSLSYVSLYDKDKTIHDSKFNIMANSIDMSSYNKQFFFFKRSYRSRFKESYLEKYGMSYKSVDTSIVLGENEQDIRDRILNDVDEEVTDFMYINIIDESLVAFCKFVLQNHFRYEYYMNEQILITTYTGSNKDDLCCSGADGIVMCKCCDDNDDCDNDDCDGDDPSCKAIYDSFKFEYTNGDRTEVKITLTSSLNEDIEQIEVISHINRYDKIVILEYYIDVDYAISQGYTVDDPDRTRNNTRLYIADAEEEDSIFYDLEDNTESMTPIVCLKRQNEIIADSNHTRKILRKYALHPDDLMETLENEDLDNLYLMSGAYFKDIYKLEPKTYNAEEAQNFPPAVLRRAKVSDDEYTITEEIASWWKRRNRLKMSRYNKFLVDLLNYYGNTEKLMMIGEDSVSTYFDFETLDPVFSDGEFDGPNGVILPSTRLIDGNYSKTSAIFVEDRPYEVEKTKDWFFQHQQGEPWMSTIISQDNDDFIGCFHNWSIGDTYEYCIRGLDVLNLEEGETLTVKVKCSSIFVQHYTDDGTPYYVETVIKELVQKLHINHQRFTLNLSGKWTSTSAKNNKGDDIYPLVPIPNDMMNKLMFSTYSIVKEYGTMFIAYAEVTVNTHWYDKFLSLIISIVIGIFTFGIGNIAIIIAQAVINFVISIVIQAVLKAIDSPLFNLIFELVSMLYGDFSALTNLTAENFLKLATDITSFANDAMMYIKHKDSKDMQDELSREEAIDRINKLMDTEKKIIPKADQTAMYSYVEQNSPEALYQSVLNGPFNFEQLFDVSGELTRRVNVVSG